MDVVEWDDSCWLWAGATTKGGYGQFWDGNKVQLATRWIMGVCGIEGVQVCHHCDNPGCVRPDHLFVGNRADNMNDASQKGRLSEKPSGLLEADVRQIHKLGRKDIPQKDIARAYGISEGAVSMILSGS